VADDDDKRDSVTRRGALQGLILGGGAAFGCALAVPAAGFIAAPLRAAGAKGARWVKTIRFDSLKEGEPKKVAIVADLRDAWTLARDVDLGAAWLIRRGENVTAFSVVCPHLGCSVNAEPSGFGCPCHTSAFDPEGKKVSGPSPRDMDPLSTKLEDGYVHVDFHKFRIGVAERLEVG
jgi:menaquinol-cytochrome c reductase iron-sulfur subunit